MQTFDYKKFIAKLGVKTEDLDNFLNISKIKFSDDYSPWLAGGALRRTINGEKINSDFDIFFRSQKKLEETQKVLSEFKITKSSETALLLEGHGLKINLIKMFYGSPDELIDSFDYTICQVVSDMKTISFGDYTLFDIARRRLRVHKITYPVASMRRIIKYANQGYYACPGMMREFLTEVVSKQEAIENSWNYID